MTIGGKYIGINLRIMWGSDNRRYLSGVIWYPRGRRVLGYLYPAIRWF